MSSRAATLTGFGAVALWALLALLTAATGPVPPFQLLALTFAIGGGLGALSWLWRPRAAAALVQRPAVWALGIAGLFGYHAVYFAALKLAPPAESALINYLWPLLIVLFSSLLPGHRLRAQHLAGALLGFAGVAVLVAGRGAIEIRPDYWAGYACAFACAFVWAGYSVLSRRVAAVPTEAVTGFCLATAALGLVCHLLFERTIWPDGPGQWAAIVASGIGPVGAAFYLWDIGMKQGDIRLLGIGSYAIPVVSTGILVLAGFAEPSWSLALACALIAAGAIVATMPASWRRR
jgi:drug/metabolite transporter (DMT)-like permease